MERSVLRKVLDRAPGLSETDGSYTVGVDHRASLYLGLASQTTMVGDLVRLSLRDDHLEIESKEGTRSYFAYEHILGFAVQPPRGASGRTGF
ncbi:MAG: hypothetical protein ACFCGT_10115 [Sandaracinaceae bacterium]